VVYGLRFVAEYDVAASVLQIKKRTGGEPERFLFLRFLLHALPQFLLR